MNADYTPDSNMQAEHERNTDRPTLNAFSEWLGHHMSSRIVLASLGMFVLTMGLMAAILVSSSNQDMRQSANYTVPTCSNTFSVTAPQTGLYVQPTADNIWPWTNNGPTVAWTSPATNISTICNGSTCWQFQPGTGWLNDGVPKTLAETMGGSWTPGQSPDAAWESMGAVQIGFAIGADKWIYDRNTNALSNVMQAAFAPDTGATAAWTDPVNDFATICNGSICRSWNNTTNSWRINPGYDISTNAAWSNIQGGGSAQIKPWTAGGPTSAWGDTINKKVTICNQGWCWIYYYTADGGSVGFRDGQPYSMCKAFSPAGADPSCQY